MDLLTFFALPLATIILAFVLEKIIRLPILTALTFFASYLIVAFTAFDSSFLPNVIVYTLIAYISALIAEVIYTNYRFKGCVCNCNSINDDNDSQIVLSDNDVRRITDSVVNTLINSNSNCRRR